jgi:hypothetical protein
MLVPSANVEIKKKKYKRNASASRTVEEIMLLRWEK